MTDDANTLPEASNDAPAGETAERRLIKLTDEQKAYVVRRLAAYDRPTTIARDVREKFGVQITRQAIAQYDPTRVPGTGKEWEEMFFAARKAHVGDQADRTVNARRIERLVLRIVAQITERILKGVEGEARDTLAKRADEITDEDRLRALQAFIDKLKTAHPAGYAAIQRALRAERDESRASDMAAGEAVHAA